MNRISSFAILALSASAATAQDQAAVGPGKSLIVFHAPSINETYYRPKFEQLLEFYQDFVEAAHPKDHPIVVCDAATRPRLEPLINEAHLMTGAARDIWVRDFGPINTRLGVFKCRYRPQYLPAEDAAWIETGFTSFFPQLKIPSQNLNLVLDGGNFVANEDQRAVVTTRILEDNPSLTETQIRNLFRDRLGIDELALIPPEAGDTTAHSDGMVKWITRDVLAMNRYTGGFRNQVRNALQQQLPGVTLVEIPWNPTDRVWRDFADATGVYVNAMTTPNALYVPVYGLNTDAQALAAYRAHADRPVIGVPVDPDIAIMGGAARCLCWQVSGPAAANAPFSVAAVDTSGLIQDFQADFDLSSQRVNLSWRTDGVVLTRTPNSAKTIYPTCRIQRSLDLEIWEETGDPYGPANSPQNYAVQLTGQTPSSAFYRIVADIE